MGQTYVAEPRNKTLYGRGDITISLVHQVGLDVVADNDPPRHADITGWPEDKSKRKILAMQLAAEASLRLRLAE